MRPEFIDSLFPSKSQGRDVTRVQSFGVVKASAARPDTRAQRRNSHAPAPAAQLVCSLPPMSVREPGFGIQWVLPTEAQLGELISMELVVTNHTKEMRALRLNFSENESFLFSGHKLFHFRLPPTFEHKLSFNLVPIQTGAVYLPMPRLHCVTTGTEVVDPAAKHRVFVRPRAVDNTLPPPAAPENPAVAQSA